MSVSVIYRRAITRLVLCLIVTILGGIIVPFALYNSFGNDVVFAAVLLCLLPWAMTLANVWRHTVTDLMLVQYELVVRKHDRTRLALEQEA
jgi:hypothetical protein